jgi:hypothetical protein
VIDPSADARQSALTRLAQSREELRVVFEPRHPSHAAQGGEQGGARDGQFPRSRTMQMLMSGKGLGTVGALAGGLLLARPALVLRLLRMVPAGAVGKMLLAKAVGSLRNRPREP